MGRARRRPRHRAVGFSTLDYKPQPDRRPGPPPPREADLVELEPFGWHCPACGFAVASGLGVRLGCGELWCVRCAMGR
jgi:hypothetical protein